MTIHSNKIRNAARGEQCTMQILGVCNRNPETVVFCHLPDESHGMAHKASDISGCFACSACHDAIDRRVRSAELEERRDWYFLRALKRTITRLFQLEVLRLA